MVDWGMVEDDLQLLFDIGDELSEFSYTEADGIGRLTNPDGSAMPSRFNRVPGAGRFTGPNAAACQSCHSQPIANAGGSNVFNVIQDPELNGQGPFNQRQTIPVQGNAVIQVLAEEMTEELQALKQEAIDQPGVAVDLLVADGNVNFGVLTCHEDATCDYSGLSGISADLVVRPFGWKGNFPTVRSFSADAAAGEMGLIPDENAWKVVDPFGTEVDAFDLDGDGVARELSVGDITALTAYIALQELPTTVVELADNGMAELSDEDRESILRGQATFEGAIGSGGIGCATCHTPEHQLFSTLFMEPSPRAGGAYVDVDLQLRDVGYDSEAPIVFDLTAAPMEEPRLDSSGVARLYSDLKRHYMGEHLADPAKGYFPMHASQYPMEEMPSDADSASAELSTMIPLGEFLTPELWGVGTTGPWMHDGRALTLQEAIMLHGEDDPQGLPSEAQASRDAFASLSESEKRDVVAFLLNLVMVDFEVLEGGH